VLRRAEVLVGRGESVVLDASWTDAHHRRAAEQLAGRTRSGLVRLVCQVPTETALRRLAARARTASDATAPVAEAMAHTADPWPDATRVSTRRSLATSVEEAASAWRAATSAGK
jgi:uncharacterized protein